MAHEGVPPKGAQDRGWGGTGGRTRPPRPPMGLVGFESHRSQHTTRAMFLHAAHMFHAHVTSLRGDLDNISLGDGYGSLGAWWRDHYAFLRNHWASDAFVRRNASALPVWTLTDWCATLRTREGQSLVYARGLSVVGGIARSLRDEARQRRGERGTKIYNKKGL